MQTAVIGATGLIGRHIVNCLIERNEVSSVMVIARRNPGINHPKVVVEVIDFSDLDALRSTLSNINAVFCAVGTTQKQVGGDLEAYRRIDFDIPVNAARLAAGNGCRHFSLVSSAGADHKSRLFYSRLKGETERAVAASGIPSVAIFRPSLLLGNRDETRFAERVGEKIMRTFSFLVPAIYKPIEGLDVARAMVHLAISTANNDELLHNDISRVDDISPEHHNTKEQSASIINDMSVSNVEIPQNNGNVNSKSTDIPVSPQSVTNFVISYPIFHYSEILRLANGYVESVATSFRTDH
jgi:uncharacterized protein YbjT (DUF2867 family)